MLAERVQLRVNPEGFDAKDDASRLRDEHASVEPALPARAAWCLVNPAVDTAFACGTVALERER
jgi:hypothetical protein